MTKIEVQYFLGCPNSEKMIENVKSAITGLKVNYTETLVENLEIAAKIKFRGSPTLLINGRDYEDLPEPKYASLSCRHYIHGLPTSDEIKNKIKGS